MTAKPSVSRPHDVTLVELLKEAPGFAGVYLATALEEFGELGGQQTHL
jgi:hypothetical protein